MLLHVSHLSKSHGVNVVLNDVSLTLDESERAGIVGGNGAGKSTLLKILMGQETADSGAVTFRPGLDVGYVPQVIPDFHGHTIDDVIREALGSLRGLESRLRDLETRMAGLAGEGLAAALAEYGDVSARFEARGGHELDQRIDAVLGGLRLAGLDRSREVDTLSGGEKSRISLAALLLRSPDLLLLDEPTNHLDVATIEWLDGYLARYRGGMVVVSHDRQFLNRVVHRIHEIDEWTHQMKKYEGDYDAYRTTKALERRAWEESFERQQEEIRELRAFMGQSARQVAHNRPVRDNAKTAYDFKAGRVQIAISRNVRSAEERLRRIEADPVPRPPAPLSITPRFAERAPETRAVMSASGLGKRFGDRAVLHDVSFSLTSESRIALVGPNGAGKTTLLRLIAGLLAPDAGELWVAATARVGYLSQETTVLDPTKTVTDVYRDGRTGYQAELVTELMRYGFFRYADMGKLVAHLSLGQRRKLEIARLIAEQPNVLLLDEPTNYVSLDVLEAFEQAILDFPGPVIAVSHDRWFLRRFGGEIWRLDGGELNRYSADSEEYARAAGEGVE